MEFRRVLFRSRRPFASFLSERRSPHIEWQFRRIWQGVSRLRRTRRGNPRDPRLESRDGNACLAKVAKKGCADNGLQYREILLLSCYQRPPLDPALLPPSHRLSPPPFHPRRTKEKEQGPREEDSPDGNEGDGTGRHG